MKKRAHSTSRPWHSLSPEATCEALTSTEQGLTQQEAERRLTQYGFNKLTPAVGRGPLKRLSSQFHNVLIYVLLIAAVVTAAIDHWVDSGVIVSVVLINATVAGVGYNPHGSFKFGNERILVDDHPYLHELIRAAVLCNNARLEQKSGNWIVYGDPTEGALITLAYKVGMAPDLLKQEMPRTDIIPFESEHRYMATLHHDPSGHAFVFIKGAPERVLVMCSLQRIDGEDVPIHAAHSQQMMDEILQLKNLY